MRHLQIYCTFYPKFHSSSYESTRITGLVIISSRPLCIKVLTVSSGLCAASFFCPCLLKLPSTLCRHVSKTADRKLPLASSVSTFPLAGNRTYVHVILLSCKRVHCAAQNNVLTIAQLMLSFCSAMRPKLFEQSTFLLISTQDYIYRSLTVIILRDDDE